MPNRDNFPAIFEQLKPLIRSCASGLVVKADAPDSYSVDAPPSATYPDGLFFGAVLVKKGYVSYHLMPVYVFPDLLDGLAAPLKKRMQGKSCFNFAAPLDDQVLAELERLTVAGFERYRHERLL